MRTVFRPELHAIELGYVPSGIPTCRADDGELVGVLCRPLALISPLEEELEEVAKELQCDVLERERRSMEELQDKPLVIELVEGGDLGVAERAVGLFDEGAEILVGDLVRGDVEAEDSAG